MFATERERFDSDYAQKITSEYQWLRFKMYNSRPVDSTAQGKRRKGRRNADEESIQPAPLLPDDLDESFHNLFPNDDEDEIQ